MEQKNIAILGSTGSIGTQALQVIAANPDRFRVAALTSRSNAALLVQQALQFKPDCVVIADERHLVEVKNGLAHTQIKVFGGQEAVTEAATAPGIALVLTALVGFAGLTPTLAAIEAGKTIALANKETLVVAGGLVMALAKKHGVTILPVDSEHSAIFQCLAGEENNPLEKIILTASGGPFRGKSREMLSAVTKAEALKHPNWTMGAKITIDSATLMNKGLEVIEAKWLFGVDASQIEVIVHPQSIIHSMVQFQDGSIKAQMGLPDMKLPIQYSLTYPQRIKNDFPRYTFSAQAQLSFEQPDMRTFRNLALAFEALQTGGNMPCVLNAANEILVAEFLTDRVGFLQMSEIIETCLHKIPFVPVPSLDDFIATDRETRILATELVTKQHFTNPNYIKL